MLFRKRVDKIFDRVTNVNFIQNFFLFSGEYRA